MKVESLMTDMVFCVGSGQSLKDAAALMWEHNCGSAPVVDEHNHLIGMVTDRDLAMTAYTAGRSLDDIPVSSAQSGYVVCCRPKDSVDDVEHLMRMHQIHRVPVANDQGEPVGIISLNDIARAYVAGVRGITSHGITDTMAAICRPVNRFNPPILSAQT